MSSPSAGRSLLSPHLRSTDLGPGGQNRFLALVTPLLPGRSVLFGFPRHDQAMMNDFKELMESGMFRPVIDRSYPLAEIVQAYRYVETGQKVGNVVITVEPDRPLRMISILLINHLSMSWTKQRSRQRRTVVAGACPRATGLTRDHRRTTASWPSENLNRRLPEAASRSLAGGCGTRSGLVASRRNL